MSKKPTYAELEQRVRVLEGEQLFHQRLLGDGGPGFLHFAVTNGPIEDIHQSPEADGWGFRIE